MVQFVFSEVDHYLAWTSLISIESKRVKIGKWITPRILEGGELSYGKQRINWKEEVEMEVPPMIKGFQRKILRELLKPQGGTHAE
jgi:hypothetical protein